MTPKTFFENFGHLADAPNGVAKLRELILQMAVQGLLLPQNPDDEPASELLERIKAERLRLVKEGQAAKLKKMNPIDDTDSVFGLPKTWGWARLDEVCSYIQRGKGPKYVDKSDVPVVSQKCIQWSGFTMEPARFIDPETLEKYTEERYLRTGDLLWNSTGTGTVGRVNVYTHEENPHEIVVVDSHVTIVRPIFLDSRFVYCWIASPYVQEEIDAMASGSTKQVELNKSTVQEHVIPIPPLEEQKRIVAKVDELMQRCDRLEQSQQERNRVHANLTGASLNALTTAESPQVLEKSWRRVQENFGQLFNTPESVRDLRQAILQLAVQGKLVPQDPNDEPAEVLLEQIEEALEIVDSSTYPLGWLAVRLKIFGELVGGGTPSKSQDSFWDGDIPWVSPKDMKQDFILDAQDHITQEAVDNSSAKLIEESSVLFVVRGMILAHTFPVAVNKAKVTINQDMKALKLFDKKLVPYLLLALKALSPRILEMVSRSSHGTCKLATDDIENLVIPLPPLSEQKRIVAKVDSLMTLCDALESKLKRSQSDAERLAAAVVHHMQAA